MNVNEINNQLKKISQDSNLTTKEKQARLTILRTLIQKKTRDNYTDSLKKEFIKKYADLLEIDEDFQLEDNIQKNQEILKNYLMESEVCKYITQQGITEYDLYDLRYHAFDYEIRFGKNQSNIEKAIDLIEIANQIVNNEIQKMFVIKNGFNDIIANDILSQYNETGKQQEDGIVLFEQTSKSKQQYSKDYQLALQKLEELYVNEGTLDQITYSSSKMMLNELFNYYQNGLNIFVNCNQKHL